MKKLTSKSFKINGSRMKIAIVISFFYEEIATQLLENVKKTLLKNGVLLKNIKIIEVPGALEMPLATKLVAGGVDAVITLGAVIKGSTAHFDYVCGESYRGLMDVSLEHSLPVIFGVLTTFTYEQALERASEKEMNKGKEFAETALKMIELVQKSKKLLQ